MKFNYFLILSLLLLSVGLPNVNATPTNACGGQQACFTTEVGSISGVLSAGNIIEAVLSNDGTIIGDTTSLSIKISTPSATTPVATYTQISLTGCTAGTAQTAATTPGGGYATFVYTNTYVLTAPTCTGVIHVVLVGGILATTFWNDYIGFSLKAVGEGDNQIRLCSASVLNAACNIPGVSLCDYTSEDTNTCNLLQSDEHNTLCAASMSFGSSTCTNPTLNTVISGQAAINICSSHLGQCNGIYINGTIQDINSGTINAVLSGTVTLDNHNCNGITTTCIAVGTTNHETIDSWPSLSVSITSWPSLNAVLSGTVILDSHNCNGITTTCIATGTTLTTPTPISGQAAINICSSHLGQCNGLYLNGTFQENININSWPALTVHQDALTGTVNVVNSGGESITFSNALTVHQDPLSGTVSVVNSGGQTLTVHQDPITGSLTVTPSGGEACGAVTVCHTDASLNGNISQNNTFNPNISLGLSNLVYVTIVTFILLIIAEREKDKWYYFFTMLGFTYLTIIMPTSLEALRVVTVAMAVVVLIRLTRTRKSESEQI